jgi:phage-related protein
MKPVEWLGDSLERLRGFPRDAQRKVGYQLERLQAGHEPADWKPMPSVGLGVNELRVRTDTGFRVIYMAKFPEAVYVLHIFEKRSRKTSRADLELARTRFRALVLERRHP